MDSNQAKEKFILSRTAIQMVDATLEESGFRKLVPISDKEELYNSLNFSYKVDELADHKIESYMRTTIESYKEDNTKALELEVVFRGVFEVKEDTKIDDVEFHDFVKTQTVPQLLPHTRSFISMITLQMGVNPITLPTMDIIQSIIVNSQDANEEE